MATKGIDIDEDVYDFLLSSMGRDESFSDVLRRLLPRPKESRATSPGRIRPGRRNLWSHDEMVVVFDMYVRKGQVQGDPEIRQLASLTGRTEASIVMRLGNFVHVDPLNPNEGLVGGRAQCEPIFAEYAEAHDWLSREAASARQRLAERRK